MGIKGLCDLEEKNWTWHTFTFDCIDFNVVFCLSFCFDLIIMLSFIIAHYRHHCLTFLKIVWLWGEGVSSFCIYIKKDPDSTNLSFQIFALKMMINVKNAINNRLHLFLGRKYLVMSTPHPPPSITLPGNG